MNSMSITLKRWELNDFYKVINVIYVSKFEEIDYLTYYNIGNLLNRIRTLEYKSQYSSRETYKIPISPNEAADLAKIFVLGQQVTLASDFYAILLNDIAADIHKQFTELQHKKNIFQLNHLDPVDKMLNYKNSNDD